MPPSTTPPLLAMAIFQGVSNLPRDRFVNTFHFGPPGTNVAAEAASAATLVHSFYETVNPGGPKLSVFMGLAVDNNYEVRVYNLADAKPRAPVVTSPGVLTDRSSTESLPSEVALCLSYYSGRNLPTKRGRIYFGPLVQDSSGHNSLHVSRPTPAFQQDLVSAGLRLINESAAAACPWLIYSRKLASSETVTNVWVDSEWDVQRRRGERSDLRLTAP